MSEEQPIAPHGDGRNAAFWTPLFLAWLLALLATSGALFLGEVMGKTPCVLCWYQRIAMFPLVLVLGLGLFSWQCPRLLAHQACPNCHLFVSFVWGADSYSGRMPSGMPSQVSCSSP